MSMSRLLSTPKLSVLAAGLAALLLSFLAAAANTEAAAQSDSEGQFTVGSESRPDRVDIDMSELPPPPDDPTVPPPGRQEQGPFMFSGAESGDDADATGPSSDGQFDDESVVDEAFTDADPNFDGIGNVANPADPNIDVGPNHVVQMVNLSTQIWDKQGNSLIGPFATNGLWQAAGVGDLCRNNNSGDPIVRYDHLEDRWILSQFAIPSGFSGDPTGFCVAVSQTPDPTNGQWYLYEFVFSDSRSDADAPQVNFDYPKLSVWPDAYYLSSQRGYPGGSIDLWAFDRANMLNGNPATFQRFNVGSPALTMLPSDLDGPPPPRGTPAIFARQIDGDIWGSATGDSTDRIELFEFDVDWQDPSSSSVTKLPILPTQPFDSGLCNPGSLFDNCVPQPGTSTLLATIPNWPMFRLQFRQFPTHQTLTFNHTVDVDGSPHAGIRWYELRRSGGSWDIYQQGTFSPDGGDPGLGDDPHRWMGSVAMDKAGNMALGYTASSNNLFPSVRYTGRRSRDPLGLMPAPETTMVDGSGAVGSSRWGDYTSMVVDPVDGCSFWYTAEYGHDTRGRETRIGSFRFSGCNEADLSIHKGSRQETVVAGEELIYDLRVFNSGPDTAFGVEVTDTLPLGLDYVSDTTGGSCTLSPGTGPSGEDQLECDLGNIPDGQSRHFKIKVEVPQDYFLGGGATSVKNKATVFSDWEDPDEDNNTDMEGTFIDEEADLAVTKVCKPDKELMAGETGFCDITVENQGPSAARDVELTDEITSGTPLTLLDASPSQGSCSESGTTVKCALGNLDAGDSATVRVEFEAEQPGDINDRATVSSETPDPESSNNEDTDSVTVTPASDLVLSKSDSPDPVVAGEGLTYTLTITNDGPSDAPAVVVRDMLPAGITLDSVAGTGGAKCTEGTPGDPSDPTTCEFGTLGASTSESVTINATVLPDTRGTIRNEAEASSDNPDPDDRNNSVREDTLVEGEADLTVSKTSDKSTYKAGEEIVYTVTAENLGPSDARNVEVVDELPLDDSKIIYVSDDQGCTYDSSSHTVTCSVGTLDPGDTFTVNITVDTTSEVDGVITNKATVTSTTTDPDGGNNDVSHDVTVEGACFFFC